MAEQDPHKARMDAWLAADFAPPSNPGAPPNDNVRFRSAAEYSAHQLGKIRQALERIAAAAEKIAEKS